MATENLTLAQFFATDRNPFNYAKVEQINRDVTTAWLTLSDITAQLNLFGDESQDDYLVNLELATRFAIEDYLGMAIFATQYRTYYGDPGIYNTALFLDLPEVSQGMSGVTVNAVGYWSGNPPTLQTLATTGYFYDPTGNRVVVNSLPQTLSQYNANPIEVVYTANANILSTYPVIKQAGLLLLTHLYNNRANTTVGQLKEIPFGVATLLRPYKPLVM